MQYSLLASFAWLLALCVVPSQAVAHGGPPRALAPLRSDASGVLQVRLTVGAAQRDGSVFRFLCPAAWGGDESSIVEASSTGLVVVSSASGLLLLDERGDVQPLLDGPSERALALTSSEAGLFTLHGHPLGSEVYRVTSSGAQRLWQDAATWTSLTAGERVLLVLAFDGKRLTQALLSLEGVELLRASAELPADVISVQGRLVRDVPYVVLQDGSGASTLGHLDDSGWKSAAYAQGALAGPIASAASGLLIALDGRLTQLVEDQLRPLPASEAVSCLERSYQGHFACTRSGLRAVQSDELGAPLFDLTSLDAPDLARVPPDRRAACATQWMHFRFDLIAAGLQSASQGAMTPSDAGGLAIDGGTATQPEAALPQREQTDKRTDGCSLARSDGVASSGLSLALAPLSLLAGVLLSRARPRASTRRKV
jgi:hypothetical protein